MPLSGLAMRCARCQNENPADARFCNGCGNPIGHPDVSAAEMRAERMDEDGDI
jgi:predicted amidophosphoribosyltransferase